MTIDRKVDSLSILVLIAAILRLFSLVMHDPVLGYGNQHDMARVSACLDFWPAGTDRPKMPTPDAPLRHYSQSNVPSAACGFGSETVITGALIGIVRFFVDPDRFDIRLIGLGKAVLLVAAILFFAWRLRRRALAQLVHAIVVLTILSDPFNSLYLNTLYTEFSAVLGAYAAAMALFLMKLDAKADKNLMTVFVSGLLILLFSKNQHILLPWLLMVFAVTGVRRFVKSQTWMVIGESCWQERHYS